MKLGIGTYTFMWSIGFPGALPSQPMRAIDLIHAAERLGVRVVQFGPNLPLRTLAPDELNPVLRAAEEAAIDLEIGICGVHLAEVAAEAAFARSIGCRLIRTTAEAEEEQTPSAAELQRRLHTVLPVLQQTDTVLAVENARMPAAELAGVMDALNSPHVGVTLDTVNSLAIPEGTAEVVRELALHVRCLHIKDFRVERAWHSMGFTVAGTPAGKGQLKIPELLHRLRDSSVRANAILELWPPPQGTVDETASLEAAWAAESVHTLRQWIHE